MSDWTEPNYCPRCHEPTSLCQCGEQIARPSYDALAAENAALRKARDEYRDRLDLVLTEADALKKRVAELEPDAARYRWLRGDTACDHSKRWTQWEIRCWQAPRWTDDLRREHLDAAIDAAREGKA